MFDILTVAAIAGELNDIVLDGRIQRAGMLSRMAIGLEIYADRRRRFLVASAENDAARVLLLDREPSFDSQLVTPLLLLLRKYVRGGIVVGVDQPPLDRVVRLSIAKRLGPHNNQFEPLSPEQLDEDGEEIEPDGLEGATFVHLVIEIMGRHSNIILVDDEGRIMESVKRVTSSMSRVRPVAPRLRYLDAPAGDRADPRRLSTAECQMMLAAERPGGAIASVLPRTLRAISPQMAREIAFRALGDASAKVGDVGPDGPAAIARETRRLLEPIVTGGWAPRVYLDEERDPVAFSAVPLDHLAEKYSIEKLDSISRAAELGSDGVETAWPGKHGQRRLRLEQSIQAVRAKTESRLAALQVEAAKAGEVEKYRHWGELIYGYLWSIPAGASQFQAEEEELVPLDPALTAKENAQAYFERYRKAQSAGAHLPRLISAAHTELDYLDQIATQAHQAETFQEIEEITAEWDAHQRQSGNSSIAPRRPRSTPARGTKPIAEHNGNLIYVGRSGVENDRIAFDIAGPNDTWLHARGIPGSHVIVRWSDPAGNEEDETVEVAASLAAFYSASRESGSVEVDVTRRRFVRKIKGAGPGMVTYRNERTIRVRPKSEVGIEFQ